MGGGAPSSALTRARRSRTSLSAARVTCEQRGRTPERGELGDQATGSLCPGTRDAGVPWEGRCELPAARKVAFDAPRSGAAARRTTRRGGRRGGAATPRRAAAGGRGGAPRAASRRAAAAGPASAATAPRAPLLGRADAGRSERATVTAGPIQSSGKQLKQPSAPKSGSGLSAANARFLRAASAERTACVVASSSRALRERSRSSSPFMFCPSDEREQRILRGCARDYPGLAGPANRTRGGVRAQSSWRAQFLALAQSTE